MNRSKQAIHLKWRKEEILAHSGLSFYCRIHLSLSGSFLEELAYTTVSKKEDSNDCTLAVGVALSVSLFFCLAALHHPSGCFPNAFVSLFFSIRISYFSLSLLIFLLFLSSFFLLPPFSLFIFLSFFFFYYNFHIFRRHFITASSSALRPTPPTPSVYIGELILNTRAFYLWK
jgi:hypothetical protein